MPFTNPQDNRFFNSSSVRPNSPSGNVSKVSVNPSLPLVFSLFITQDLFFNSEFPFTPASSLTIPLINIRAPQSYLPLIALELLTILLAKYSAAFSSQSSYLALQFSQGYPDLNALRQIYRHPPPSSSTTGSSSSQQVSVTTAFNPPLASGTPSPNGTLPGSPLFPRGLAFNILLSAPLEGSENTAAFYTLKFYQIRHLHGVLVPIVIILIYLYLYPKVRAKATGSNSTM